MRNSAPMRIATPEMTTGAQPVRPGISVVIPVYNEEESLAALRDRLMPILDGCGLSWEVLLVNDGSSDSSGQMLDQIARDDHRFRTIHFSRNFGHQAAITAGVNHAAGQAVVVMDADLQDPPELLRQLIARWREGYHVVYAQRMKREREGFLKRWTAYMFYRVMQRLSDVHIPSDTGDFCLMDREVVDHLNALPERNRYMRGLRAWLGFRQTAVQFERPARHAGEPKYTFTKSARLAVDALVSFSKTPLRVATWLGLAVSATSFLLGLYFIYEKFAGRAIVRGWASTVVIVTFLGGVQLLTLGIIGEYLSRIYDEVKQRPPYIIRQPALSVQPDTPATGSQTHEGWSLHRSCPGPATRFALRPCLKTPAFALLSLDPPSPIRSISLHMPTPRASQSD